MADWLNKRIIIIDLIEPNFFENKQILNFQELTTLLKICGEIYFMIKIHKFCNLFRQLKPDILRINMGGYPGAFLQNS